MKKSSPKTSLVLSIVFALICAGLYYYAFTSAEKVYSTSFDVRQEFVNSQRNRERQEIMKDTIANFAVEREQLKTYFVRADGVVEFIESIENLGRKSGITIDVEGVSTGAITGKNNMEELKLVLSGESSWDDAMNFLYQLENLPYKSNITRATVEETEDGVWKSEYSISVIKFK
jgi:hypothetical protein